MPQGTNQPTVKPTAKVAAGGVAGTATVLVVYVASLLGVDLPPEVSAALTALFAFAAGYIKRG